MNVATRIITKLGGHHAAARLLGVHVTNVYRWTYATTQRGGTGGLIPQKQQHKILEKAPGKVRPIDFFPRPGDTAEDPKRKRKRAA